MKRTLSVILCSITFLSILSIQAVPEEGRATGDWSIETLDSSGDAGYWTSIVLDVNSFPHISYYDLENGDLKYSYRDGAEWVVEIVDTPGDVGIYSSIALDIDGKVHISYYDATNGDLKYAKRTAGGWTNQTVDSVGDVGEYTSIGLDSNGNPQISYYDKTNGDLKYAKWLGSIWNVVEVDTPGDVGVLPSLTVDSIGNPHISYYDKTGMDLKYAKWTADGWNTETVDNGTDVGLYSSIVLDNAGFPHISYLDNTKYDDGDLRYAALTPNGWAIETVQNQGDAGHFTSLSLTSHGYPHIAYYGDHALNYAMWTSGGWESEVIASYPSKGQVNAGRFISMTLDSSDVSHISFLAPSSEYQKYNLGYAKGTSLRTPDAPGRFRAIIGSGFINLTWAASSSDGGTPITKYSVYRDGQEIGSTSPTTFSFNDTSVEAGVLYNYTVAAFNEVGQGPLSATISTRPLSPPGAPGNLVATAGDTYVDLSWDEPEFDGGQPVLGYVLFVREKSTNEEYTLETENVTSYRDSGLSNGEIYFYKVSAVNRIGVGEPSEEVSVIPFGDTTDFDKDGLPDYWEIENFENLSYGPEDDPDGDGFSNADEFHGGTDPLDSSDYPTSVRRVGSFLADNWPLVLVVALVLIGLGIGFYLKRKPPQKPKGKGRKKPKKVPKEEVEVEE